MTKNKPSSKVERTRLNRAPEGDIPDKKDKSEYGVFMRTVSKTHGNGIIGKANVYPRHNHVSTGIFILDMATGGGLPQGHPCNYFGWENQGKTTMAMKAVGEFQKKQKLMGTGRKALWVAMEEFDPLWAATHGVDTKDLDLVRPDSGEMAVDIINGAARVEQFGFIVLDSIATLISMKMAEASAEDIVMAHVAKLAGPMCSKLSQSFLKERKRKHFVTVLNINQWRYKITMFGDPKILPGGTQCNFFHSTKIEIKGKEIMTKGAHSYEIVDRVEQTVEIKKAKVNSMRTGAFEMRMNENGLVNKGAIDDAATIASFARDYGFFEGSKKFYFAPFDWHLSNEEDIIVQINKVPEFRTWLGQACIAQSRLMNNGLPPFPKDGYLYGSKNITDGYDFDAQIALAHKAMEGKQAKFEKREEKKKAKNAAK